MTPRRRVRRKTAPAPAFVPIEARPLLWPSKYAAGDRVIAGKELGTVLRPVYNRGLGWLYEVQPDRGEPWYGVEECFVHHAAPPSAAWLAWWTCVEIAQAVQWGVRCALGVR